MAHRPLLVLALAAAPGVATTGPPPRQVGTASTASARALATVALPPIGATAAPLMNARAKRCTPAAGLARTVTAQRARPSASPRAGATTCSRPSR